MERVLLPVFRRVAAKVHSHVMSTALLIVSLQNGSMESMLSIASEKAAPRGVVHAMVRLPAGSIPTCNLTGFSRLAEAKEQGILAYVMATAPHVRDSRPFTRKKVALLEVFPRVNR